MIPKIIENRWNIAKSFTPEKFWEISISLRIITNLMSEFTFIRRPQRLYILGVYIWVRWIQKISWMIDSIMGIPLGQRRNRIVGFPEVRVYNGPRKYILLNHWGKIFCTPLPFNYSQYTSHTPCFSRLHQSQTSFLAGIRPRSYLRLTTSVSSISDDCYKCKISINLVN